MNIKRPAGASGRSIATQSKALSVAFTLQARPVIRKPKPCTAGRGQEPDRTADLEAVRVE